MSATFLLVTTVAFLSQITAIKDPTVNFHDRHVGPETYNPHFYKNLKFIQDNHPSDRILLEEPKYLIK